MRRLALPLILMLYVACCLWGLDWGLYSDQREQRLFPAGSGWSPQRVSDLRSTEGSTAADVDPNPVAPATVPVVLNDSDERIAEVYARYLLYSGQPDEQITFRALRAAGPPDWKLDPRMYQYGGLFIYPLGALIKLASLSGWLSAQGLAAPLRHPAEFAKCYIVGRAYVVMWGLLGLWVVFALGGQLSDWRGGALSALLFALLPVTVSLSHECKPHLPGAVLMLWAVLWALKYVQSGRVRHRLLLASACGLACGMVLSSLWILLLIPLAEFLTAATISERLQRSLFFVLLAVGVYALTNPFVVINLFADRDVLSSNLGNSTAMYAAGQFAAGLSNASTLLLSASSGFVVIAGLVMLVALWGWDWRRTLIVAGPALIVFIQFAALAAGKPGEYGRFAVFPSAVLCIVLASGVFRFLVQRWYQGTIFAIASASTVAWPALPYLVNLHLDNTAADSRYELAKLLQPDEQTVPLPNSKQRAPIGVLRDPAPYAFPPLDFSTQPIVRLPRDIADWPPVTTRTDWPPLLVVPINGIEGVDAEAIIQDGYYQPDPQSQPMDYTGRAPITWANKPLILLRHGAVHVEMRMQDVGSIRLRQRSGGQVTRPTIFATSERRFSFLNRGT